MKIRTFYIVVAMLALVILSGCSSQSEVQVPVQETQTTEEAKSQESQTTEETVVEVETTSELNLPESADYVLESEKSILKYGGYRLTGNGHTGTVKISEGSLTRSAGAFTSGKFTMDMTTITDDRNSSRFLDHVKNEDFFDVANYPTSTFIATSITAESDNQFNVTGDLTILNNTKEISFPAVASLENGELKVVATFQIDRTKWGITYDSGNFFQQLGDRAIKDEIDYNLNLVFK